MAFRLAEAYVQFGQRGVSGLSGVLSGLHQRIMGLLNPTRLVTGALGAMGAALTVREIGSAFGRQEQAEKRLEAVVRATGGAAGYASEQLKAMASDLQQVTTTGDEATLEAQAMLLTFKSIRGDIFKGVLESSLDIAAVFGIDIRSAVLQMGKAFEDPAQQMTYLRRSGITFSKEQQEQIKNLQKMGDLLGAQRVMLQVIQGQFGGAARAMAQTTTGAFQQMRNAVGDVMEKIGSGFARAFDLSGVAARLRTFAEGFWSNYGGKIETAFAKIRSVVSGVFASIAKIGLPPFHQIANAAGVFGKMVAEAIKLTSEFVRVLKKALGPTLSTVFNVALGVMMTLTAIMENRTVKVFVRFVAILAGVGGLTWAFLQVVTVVQKLVSAIILLTEAQVILTAISGPIGWVGLAAGIAAAVVSVSLLRSHFRDLKHEADAASQSIGQVAEAAAGTAPSKTGRSGNVFPQPSRAEIAELRSGAEAMAKAMGWSIEESMKSVAEEIALRRFLQTPMKLKTGEFAPNYAAGIDEMKKNPGLYTKADQRRAIESGNRYIQQYTSMLIDATKAASMQAVMERVAGLWGNLQAPLRGMADVLEDGRKKLQEAHENFGKKLLGLAPAAIAAMSGHPGSALGLGLNKLPTGAVAQAAAIAARGGVPEKREVPFQFVGFADLANRMQEEAGQRNEAKETAKNTATIATLIRKFVSMAQGSGITVKPTASQGRLQLMAKWGP